MAYDMDNERVGVLTEEEHYASEPADPRGATVATVFVQLPKRGIALSPEAVVRIGAGTLAPLGDTATLREYRYDLDATEYADWSKAHSTDPFAKFDRRVA